MSMSNNINSQTEKSCNNKTQQKYSNLQKCFTKYHCQSDPFLKATNFPEIDKFCKALLPPVQFILLS